MTIGPLWGPSPNRPQCGRYLIAGLLRRVCTGRFGSQRDGANQEVMSKIVSKWLLYVPPETCCYLPLFDSRLKTP